MKAIFWKTTRELLPWAVLGMAVFVGALWLWLRTSNEDLRVEWNYQPLLLNEVPVIAWLVGSLLGLTMGVAMVAWQAHGKQWELLMHRPLGRWRIFLAESAAAILLYAVAMGLPILAVASWLNTLHFVISPFTVGMLGPSTVVAFAGLPCFFAGVLMIQRQGRWWTRALVLPAVFGVVMVALDQPSLLTALGCLLVPTVILGLAVGSAVVAGGQEQVQKIPGCLAGGVVLGTGIWCVLFVVMLLTAMYFNLDLRVWAQPNFQLSSTGEVLLGGASPKYTWAMRETLEELSHESRPEQELRLLVTEGMMQTDPDVAMNRAVEDYRSGLTLMREVGTTWQDGSIGTIWYYLPKKGRVFGYSVVEQRCIGSVGPGGFAAEGEPVGQRLSGEPVRQTFFSWSWALSSGIYSFDETNRAIRVLYQSPPGMRVLDAALGVNTASGLEATWLAVLTSDGRLRVVDTEQGREYASVALEGPHAVVKVLPPKDHRGPMVWCRKVAGPWDSYEVAARLRVFDAATGEQVQQAVLPTVPVEAPNDVWLGAIAPPAGMVGLLMISGDARIAATRSYATWPGRATSFVLLAIHWAITSALVNGLWAWRWGLGRRRVVIWSLIGLALGPAGVLLLPCMVNRPAKVRCPSCERWRVVTRDGCERCGAAFPAPTPNGTEVFA